MKESIILLLLLTMLFSVSACGKDKAKTSSSELSSESTSSESSLAQSSENSSGEKSGLGTFHSLQDAYDNGWLNQEQLLSIAYHSGNRDSNEELMGENYTPIPKTPETLDAETDLEIKQAYLYIMKTDRAEYKDLTLDNVIMSYYGTYDECIVLRLYLYIPGTGTLQGGPYVEIGGVSFWWYNSHPWAFIVYKK